jgi:hypothetical protein
LAEEKRYQSLVDRLDPGRIGQFYVDVGPFIDQAMKSDPRAAGQMAQMRSLFSVDRLPPVGGSLLADGDRIAVDSLTRGRGVGTHGPFGSLMGVSSTPLLGELPGDTWAALGAAKVGPGLKAMFSRGAGAFGGAVVAQQLKQQLGLDLQRDVFGWIGDVAVFARGTSRANLDGGVVISSTNATRMRAAFGKLVGLVQTKGGQKVTPVRVAGAEMAFRAGGTNLGKPVVLARSDDRVVVAVGEAAASAALAPASKLGDSALFSQARAILAAGQEPSFLLSMPQLLTAIERTGGADADFAKAKPYLDAFSVLAAGGTVKGAEARSRFAAGLK